MDAARLPTQVDDEAGVSGESRMDRCGVVPVRSEVCGPCNEGAAHFKEIDEDWASALAKAKPHDPLPDRPLDDEGGAKRTKTGNSTGSGQEVGKSKKSENLDVILSRRPELTWATGNG